MRLKAFFLIFIMVISFNDMSFAATRVAYTRPGIMMKIPFSTVGRSPYLFRTHWSANTLDENKKERTIV
jgi:hypothetical protein